MVRSLAINARAVALAAVLATAPAAAQPLSPVNFTPVGAFVPAGDVTVNTTTLEIRDAATNALLYTGVTSPQANGGPTVAVFTFTDVAIPAGVTVTASG